MEVAGFEESFPSGRRARPGRRLGAVAVAACVLAGGVALAVSLHHGRGRTEPSPKEVAERTAAKLRDSALLPPGARLYSGARPNVLTHAFDSRATPNLVDLERMWIVDEPSDAVVSFLSSHRVTGMGPGECCGSEGNGAGAIVRMVGFDQSERPPPSSVIVSTDLQMQVTKRGPTSTWVRADAQVVWRARRDPSEYVPATDRVVTIRLVVTTLAKASPHAYTGRATVDRLARAFNALPVAVPGPSNGLCDGNEFNLRFSDTKTSPPDVVVDVNCGYATVTVRGRPAAMLDAGPLVSALSGLY